jgi:hypothetical protein
MCADVLLERDSVKRIFATGFFHESSSPMTLKITLRPLQKISKVCRDICKSRYTTGINDTVNFPAGTPGGVDTCGKFGEEGAPQISSANSKSANLQTFKICNVCGPSTSVAICAFVICRPNIFRKLQICIFVICGPDFLADLKLSQIRNFFNFLLTNTFLKCSNLNFYKIKNSAKQICSRILDSFAIKGGKK